ncbi:hypothetical protein [uncultured Sphingomonas sp.]|uniref:hypothetical protein n=1 Tax=uncultured Sphingomonas sp. TaxID=158754 RepID=UPI002604AF12|nr:hypothetical protein [uncultured Sphingomonas sp.]
MDELAARRCLYPRPLPTAPALMVIDVPKKWAGANLPLGRFYPIIIESDEELSELEAYLAAPRTTPIVPDLLATRPSRLIASAITFFEFAPPAVGWPWFLVAHWPEDLAAISASLGPDMLARNAYTFETFASRDELIAAASALAGLLGGASVICSYSEMSDTGNA